MDRKSLTRSSSLRYATRFDTISMKLRNLNIIPALKVTYEVLGLKNLFSNGTYGTVIIFFILWFLIQK